MSNVIDICNAACAQLGNNSNIISIDPPDGTRDADLCAMWYPQALKYLLEQHSWGFAQKRKQLTAYTEKDENLPWKYAFAIPSDCVRITRLDKAGYKPTDPPLDFDIDYRSETDSMMLLCNDEAPIITYTCYVENADRYPAYFVQALVMQLASFLVGPMLKNSQAKTYIDLANQAISHAKTMDCKNTRRLKLPTRIPSMIRARWV